ncbi:hypothetical protein PLICRDRAFT_95773 [Plicaturopsis crispa FD-325 SS-3]|uniref:Protein kinase domain-containing protein n=1 Tax=Plicaturopsis crispa FD-325 SS-3 TaxID=944288 RepID=A0A0C9SKI5_PLICR|nr:hypothetical protein PLICRDRAFT_95773 [Plicaturopsis crispa FD-325 SS-3]
MSTREYSKLEFTDPQTGKFYSLSNSRHRATRATTTGPSATATIIRTIHDTRHSIVYRASVNGREVILKCSVYSPLRDCSYTDLEREAETYRNALAKLQGKVVPRSYGFYRSPDDAEEAICCLVLEDCGDMVYCFYDLPADDQLEIMLHVKALHDKGLALRDFAERNVVCRNGDYRLIDFHDTDNHTCEWNGDLHVGKGTPVGLICRYMLDCGLDMHFWPPQLPPSVYIGKTRVPAKWYPSQTKINELLQDLDEELIGSNFDFVQEHLLCYQEDVVAGRKPVSVKEFRRRVSQLPFKMKKGRFVLGDTNNTIYYATAY